MNVWLKETYGLLVHFFGRETPMEAYIVMALCVLLGALALSRICTALGSMGAFYTTGVVLVPAGVVLLIAALALSTVLGLKAVWAPVATAALIFLTVVVPLTMLFQKGKYVPTLISWTVVILVAGAVLTLEPRVMRSIDQFKSKFESGRLFNQRRADWSR